MPRKESFCALVGQMELTSSIRVFQARKMRPPSPNDEKLDWSIVAARQVVFMLNKSRIVERRNLKKDIEKMMPEVKKNKDEKEVSTILADMTSFAKKPTFI